MSRSLAPTLAVAVAVSVAVSAAVTDAVAVAGPLAPAPALASDRGEGFPVEPEEILPPVEPWDGASRALLQPPDAEWATPFERSGGTRSPSHAETLDWLRRLCDASPRLHLLALGRSAEGREVALVVASAEGARTPSALRRNGKPTLLAQAGIHPGEIDGKDAGMMLLRDMTIGGTKADLLERANFLFVPILGVDGHERASRWARINQRGPEVMGWRTNARNLNLNRDYAKLDTEELRALVRAVNEWEPDLYLDLHVTDGVDYRYDITHGHNGPWAWSPAIAAWLDGTFAPAVDVALRKAGHVPGPLVFAANGRDLTAGNVHWTAPPRFSNGWGDARHLPTVLVENHSLKPFDRRVLGTYVFLEAALEKLGTAGETLRRAIAADRARRPETVPLGFRADPSATPPEVEFLGIRSETVASEISGGDVVRWTGEPVDTRVSVIVYDRPAVEVPRPAAYRIPAAWSDVAESLVRQGIEVERVAEPAEVDVEVLRLPDAALDVESTPFEGRARYTAGEPRVERRRVRYGEGSFRVSTDQPLGTLAVLLLEPQCGDSLFSWGAFASILQRTEYAEAYALEPLARRMLEADPELRREFEARLADDEGFAADPAARLAFFYERSPWYDAAWRVYPVAREPRAVR